MKRIIGFVLCMVMLFCFCACGAANNEKNKADSNNETEEKLVETYTVEAAGLQFKYPAQWQDKVTTETSETKISFFCGDIKLFDLLLNSEEGTVLGTVEGDENTVISVVSYNIEKGELTDEEFNELCAMQEAVNVVVENLQKDYDFTGGEAVEKTDTAVFEIDTDTVSMKYPAKWKDKVNVSIDGSKVSFKCGDVALFDLIFGDSEEYLLGSYDGTEIHMHSYDIEKGSLSDAEFDELCAMQDDVNVILQYLQEDDAFEINCK